jgi:ABC-type bacteriocin/lantibiotic exporter with double-glycine peptidase domain
MLGKSVSLVLIFIQLVGRQNSDTQVINEAMNNSFNTVMKSIVYTTLVLAYLLFISPQLLGVLLLGLLGLSLVSGFLRRTTKKLNTQYLEEKSRLV